MSGGERWLLTYADLITLLLAFFVVLYATANQDLEKFAAVRESLAKAFNVGIGETDAGSSPVFDDAGAGIAPVFPAAQQRDFETIGQSLSRIRDQFGLGGKIDLRWAQDNIVIGLSDNLLFDPASATLKPGAELLLDEVAKILLQLPNVIRVEGHTDNIPINTGEYASNWELASARATNVLRYLVESGGLSPERVYAAAYGETRPIASNDRPEGRARNRRADIVVIYPPGDEAPALKGTD